MISITLLLYTCRVSSSEEKELQFGAIATACPEATEVGKQILTNGGNAADAAIAISFALAVAEPAMSGLGGGTQIIMNLKDGIPFAINGSTLSPSHVEIVPSKDSLKYLHKSTIPSTVKVLGFLYDQYASGTFTWSELVQPAIDLCRNGFIVGPYRALVYQRHREDILAAPVALDVFVDENGHFPSEGSRIKQPTLASTLDIIAKEGPESFYTGSIAQKIDDWMSSNDGWITSSDLSLFPVPSIQKAIASTYRDHEVYTMPPPCGGWVVCKMLNELAKPDLKDLEASSRKRLEALTSSLYTSHELRRKSPIHDFQNYEDQLKDRLLSESGETTHFSVADANGMTLAVTASINAYFGCKTGSPELGFLFNTYMDDFIFDDPSHSFALGPNKMAYSSMSPTVLQKEDKSTLAIGSPGSSRIISAVAQCIQLYVDTDLSLVDINRAARVHTSRNYVMVESPSYLDSLSDLISKESWEVETPSIDLALPPLNAYFGGIHMVGIRQGQWEASADPRRDGAAWAN